MTDEKRKARGGGEREEGGRVEVRGALDRVEDGDTAVLILEDEAESQLDIPLSRLPEGASGGDHFRLTFEAGADGRRGKLLRVARDEQSRAATEDRIRSLQQRLAAKSDTGGKKNFKL